VIHRFLIELGGREHDLAVERLAEGRYRVTRAGQATVWDARPIGDSWSLMPEGGGPTREVHLDRGAGGELTITTGMLIGVRARVSDPLHRAAERAAAERPAGPAEVKSPMPGKVVRALVRAGESVSAGQAVVVVEAMKMENELKSPRDGTVAEVRASEGQAIEAGQTLVVLS
jgi:acetyl/propionyl-CoA carboxylase alpha subunit